MKSFRSVLVLVALIGLGMLTASAQDTPAAEKAFLQHFAGEWEATAKFMGGETKGTEKNRLDGGQWLISDFAGEFSGQKFTGHGVQGYDKHKKKITGVWVDSMEASMMHYSGTLDATGKVLSCDSEGVGPDGKPTKMRLVTEIVDKDTHVFKMFNSPTDAQPMMTITYKRKK